MAARSMSWRSEDRTAGGRSHKRRDVVNEHLWVEVERPPGLLTMFCPHLRILVGWGGKHELD